MSHYEERRSQEKRQIGTVLHVSKSTGHLIIMAESDADTEAFVFDKSGKRVGIIFDFFGPVKTPYMAVKPFVEGDESFMGKPLYVEERKGRPDRSKKRHW